MSIPRPPGLLRQQPNRFHFFSGQPWTKPTAVVEKFGDCLPITRGITTIVHRRKAPALHLLVTASDTRQPGARRHCYWKLLDRQDVCG